MFYGRNRLFTGILRNFFGALVLASAFLPAVHADEGFYYLQPQAFSGIVPQASAPVAVKSGSAYLSASQLRIADFPAPPAAGSDQDKADLATVLQWQKNRTDAQCAAAMAQADETFVSLFSSVNPFPAPLPAPVDAFFKKIAGETSTAESYIKKVYQRPRPFVSSPEVNPCVGRPEGYSYPSGHAALSHLYALILSDLKPREGSIFMMAADQDALNRVIGGAHNPSDVEAGKKLGGLLYQKLRAVPAFVTDEQALSQYLR